MQASLFLIKKEEASWRSSDLDRLETLSPNSPAQWPLQILAERVGMEV